jgi:hypothetical protein
VEHTQGEFTHLESFTHLKHVSFREVPREWAHLSIDGGELALEVLGVDRKVFVAVLPREELSEMRKKVADQG